MGHLPKLCANGVGARPSQSLDQRVVFTRDRLNAVRELWTPFLVCVFLSFWVKWQWLLPNLCKCYTNMCTDSYSNSHNQTDTMSFFKNKLKSNLGKFRGILANYGEILANSGEIPGNSGEIQGNSGEFFENQTKSFSLVFTSFHLIFQVRNTFPSWGNLIPLISPVHATVKTG